MDIVVHSEAILHKEARKLTCAEMPDVCVLPMQLVVYIQANATASVQKVTGTAL